ncbi:MAG TPA: U32 family peptidase [Candidatus Onthousia faecipullorum]|uniref:U32 family peptidase n=1 Tax=Candidatus Onthousia faecipullorum TaxID=2840887 RepID=A0A9D1GB24_9FIRM|nr:U32 family peptidase [Candidatus Onthousia faecipullorum]
MKLLGVIRDDNYLEYLDTGIDGVILPLENFSVDYFKYYSIFDIREYRKNTDKLLFVVINKMIFNSELEDLLKILKELENIKVDGVFFYDLAVFSLVKEHNLNLNLIYNGTFMVTNSDTINLYYDLGVKGVYLSNEITKDEVLNIRSNTKSDLFILLLGNPVVAMSRRSLLTSYFLNKNKSKSNLITIKEPKSGQEFLVKEDSNGTTFFYNKRLNLSNVYKELKDSGINYGIIEQGDYDSNQYKELINAFVNFNKKKIDELAGHNRGFLYRETIYKVK